MQKLLTSAPRPSSIRTRRRRWFALAALAALLVSAACSSSIDGAAQGTASLSTDASESSNADPHITEPSQPSDPAPTAEPTDPTTEPVQPDDASWSPPAELLPFYEQDLNWGDCLPFATTSEDQTAYRSDNISCAYLTVPLDYADPSGETIRIAVVKQDATGDRIGSVMFNPGGPGASGVSIVATLARYGIAPRLAARFDYIGFDPRGVGASEPHIACQTDEQQDANRAANWPGFMASETEEDVAAANERSQQFVQDCIDTISGQGVDGEAFLAQVGTTNVAKDLDVLRGVMGDDALTYVGWSYGTSIGTQYAEQFPQNVRAMILDGALDPTLDSASDSLQQTIGFQEAFEDFAAWCVDQSGCPWSAAEDATSTFQKLAQPLMDDPLPLSDGRELSFLDAIIGVAGALYSDSTWPTLLQALANFADGSGAGLMASADSYYDRDSSGHYSRMLESFTAIRCMDSDRMTDPDEVTALDAKLKQASPFQDNGQPAAPIFDTCAYWPVEPTMLPHTPEVSGLDPILVISTTGDPATPYEAGVQLAKDLGAQLLTVEGTRHTAYMLSGISCVNRIGDDYLIDLTLPDEGATCS